MKLLAVVPLFNPDSAALENVEHLSSYLNVVYVDDGSEDRSHIAWISGHQTVLDVIENGENRGIAAALNSGFARVSRDLEWTHVVTFDQDTVVSESVARRLLAAVEAHPRAILYPECLGSVQQPGWKVSIGPETVWRARDPMQSGMVIPLQVFADVGRFNEDLFIDCVDSEFVLRARGRGWTDMAVEGVDLLHSAGAKEVVLGRRRDTHSPRRIYFIVRNRVWVATRYGARFPREAGLGLLDAVKATVKCLISRRSVGHVTALVARATYDGLVGRLGPRAVR